ncbi:MAG: hypothetical protein IJC13_00160 [Clostridia bacterium]|nr:hypothetical protein [Clostridia bacterium]
MRKIRVSDITLRECANSSEHSLSFKEKIEIAKLMDKLHYDSIEMPEIKNVSTDVLLIKTIASLMKYTQVVVPVGFTAEGVETAWNSVKGAEKPALKVSVPVSAVQMEYKCGKKPPVVKDMAASLVAECKKYTDNIEFTAEDAMRAEKDFLYSVIASAIEAGATSVCVCDSEGTMMPSELADFVKDLYANVPALEGVVLSVQISDNMNMAVASAFAAVGAGAGEIKTVADGFAFPTIESVMKVLKLRGDSMDVQSKIRTTELNRVIGQMQRMISTTKSENSPFENGVNETAEALTLDKNDDISTVIKAIRKIGYDLSEEDNSKVYDAFKRVAAKKDYVGTKELEAIIASTALQVPSTYTIESYVINSGNVITATANIKLVKDGEAVSGVSVGDGPIDAAFLAIEHIVGHHYELDDFQIKSVTEGREAMGSALVKLRSASGKLYSGTGISTDVIGASIRAYVSALNKIAYEEE